MANSRIRDASEMRCLACGSEILLLGSGEWICLSDKCNSCSPDFGRKENIEPLGKLFVRVVKHDPGLFLCRPVPLAIKSLFPKDKENGQIRTWYLRTGSTNIDLMVPHYSSAKTTAGLPIIHQEYQSLMLRKDLI
jgi:hypothetical protein